MAQIIFVRLLVAVMVVSYVGGSSWGELGGFVKPAKVNKIETSQTDVVSECWKFYFPFTSIQNFQWRVPVGFLAGRLLR